MTEKLNYQEVICLEQTYKYKYLAGGYLDPPASFSSHLKISNQLYVHLFRPEFVALLQTFLNLQI